MTPTHQFLIDMLKIAIVLIYGLDVYLWLGVI
jgi:hypothetical protein